MNYRAFGKTGLSVSEIGFGAWAVGGGKFLGYGATNDSDSVAAIKRALELGVTFFDTADVYGHGHSEELLGRIAGRSVVVATKVGYDFHGGPVKSNFSETYVRRACEDSLRRVRRDAIDVYQAHNPTIDDMGVVEILQKLKAEGKARFIGVSIAKPEEVLAAIEAGIDSVQLVLNAVQTEHVAATLPALRRAGIAVIAREPLLRGLLSGKFTRESKFPDNDARSRWDRAKFEAYVDATAAFVKSLPPGVTPVQGALRFVLSHAEISVVIPGAKTSKQVEENASAA